MSETTKTYSYERNGKSIQVKRTWKTQTNSNRIKANREIIENYLNEHRDDITQFEKHKQIKGVSEMIEKDLLLKPSYNSLNKMLIRVGLRN